LVHFHIKWPTIKSLAKASRLKQFLKSIGFSLSSVEPIKLLRTQSGWLFLKLHAACFNNTFACPNQTCACLSLSGYDPRACENHILRVESHSSVSKSHSCVWKSHSSVSKSHSACCNYTRMCWNHTRCVLWKIERVLANFFIKIDTHACEIHTQTCHFHTVACHIFLIRVRVSFCVLIRHAFYYCVRLIYKNLLRIK
jgi:hypothetical protein